MAKAITVRDLADLVYQNVLEYIEKFNDENDAVVGVDPPELSEDNLEVWIDGGNSHGVFVIVVEMDTPGDDHAVVTEG